MITGNYCCCIFYHSLHPKVHPSKVATNGKVVGRGRQMWRPWRLTWWCPWGFKHCHWLGRSEVDMCEVFASAKQDYYILCIYIYRAIDAIIINHQPPSSSTSTSCWESFHHSQWKPPTMPWSINNDNINLSSRCALWGGNSRMIPSRDTTTQKKSKQFHESWQFHRIGNGNFSEGIWSNFIIWKWEWNSFGPAWTTSYSVCFGYKMYQNATSTSLCIFVRLLKFMLVY